MTQSQAAAQDDADAPRLAQDVEVRYQSSTTRIFRYKLGRDASGPLFKERLDVDAVQRLSHERAMLERLAGVDGVVQLADLPRSASVLALQDCAGVPLAHALRQGPLEPEQLLALAVRLARTVAAVHRAGIIHGDICPANIVLPTSCHDAVLVDFDLATPAGMPRRTVHGDSQIVGSLAYLAPEQTGRSRHPVDLRADLYALGATLYEAGTGRPPFDESDALQLIHAHLVREPVAPVSLNPRLPKTFSDIVMRLLAKAPDARYQSAEGLVHDLVRLQDDRAGPQAAGFALGECDFAARLAPPARLVGRDTELDLLQAAFAVARGGACQTLLIEGGPGVGKSALVNELQPAVAAADGWFVYGKFDQYQRDADAGAVTQALRALGGLLLAEPKEELAAHRQRILERLGRHAALMTPLPEFALLLGEQPEVPALDPGQAELRMQQTTLDLLGAIASSARPLVIVLDDLQWASGQSLRMFERIMSDASLRGLLLVGAYRGGEVDASHPMAPMLARWSQSAPAPQRLALTNLAPAGVHELVEGMLRLPAPRAAELAGAVGALTDGNPFDTVEMINALRHDGVLRLGEQGWQWDVAAIGRFVGQSNVVDLLAARIARLPTPSRELLACMSCLGGSIEPALLAAAAGVDEGLLRERLGPPLEDGLLVSGRGSQDSSVHFRHDRVQQAVLDGLDAAQRAHLQLDMARRLALEPRFAAQAAQQYLGCAGLLRDPQEQRRAAHLFHDLARELADAANHALAERYLGHASALIETLGDPQDTTLRRSVDRLRHAALYSLGRMDDADSFYASLSEGADDPLECVESACLQIRSLDMRGRSPDALALGLALLPRLGLAVPATFINPQTLERLGKLGHWVAQENQFDPSQLGQAREPRALAIAMLLNRMLWSSFIVDTTASVWLLLESQHLWSEHGPCPALVAALSHMGIMLIGARQDYRTGYEAARHVLRVGQARGYEPETSEARQMFSASASHWFEPLEDTFRHVVTAREGLLAGGDQLFASYTYRISISALLDCAPTLEAYGAEVHGALALARRIGHGHAVNINLTDLQFLRALRGQTQSPASFADDQFDPATHQARLAAHPIAVVTWHLRCALAALLFDDTPALIRQMDIAMPMLGCIPGYYLAVHAHLLRALALAARLRTQAPEDAQPLLRELEHCAQWLAARAADQPANFLHLARLVEAEQAWARNDLLGATGAFDAALQEALHHQRPWHRALITEHAAQFHLARGWAHTGCQLLGEARDLYARWGATAKVRMLEARHASLLAVASPPAPTRLAYGAPVQPDPLGAGVSSQTLDLMGVLRASQAMSSETSLERLTARVNEVLAAMTGATRVSVVSWSDDQWWLLAQTSDGQGARPIPVEEAAQRGLLPMSAFRYAERTGAPLLVDDATRDHRFARDPYLAGLAHCSLLLVPMTSQGTRRAMLVLENRLGQAAFSAERLDAVMLIAGQLAVSLVNVQLYESLEERVRARTLELEQTQAQLVATARRAGMAEVANNVLHNVGNVLNSVNVSTSVVNRKVQNSKGLGLTRAVELINEHPDDLADFLTRDERGRLLPAYLTRLAAALAQERQELADELDKMTRSVDHIKDIVATQQSYAGASSLEEAVQVQELIEDALRMNAGALARHDIAVIREFGMVPPLRLDKPRVLQILVNLIGNAAQAMSARPASSLSLTLSLSVHRQDGQDRVRITVRDEGEGITAENLTRIFAHGFTTKKDGHGFGLHSSAMAAREMGGTLTAHSDGADQGAVFTLELPAGGLQAERS